MRFKNKVCLITGGTSGIGRAICQRLAAEGGHVIALGRNQAEGAETVRLIEADGGSGEYLPCDLANSQLITLVVSQVVLKHGYLDVLVSCAATMPHDLFVDLPLADWDLTMDVNLRALAQLSQLCLPHMRAGSAIVTISSVHAFQTTPRAIAYATSKGGMEAFVRGLSRELDLRQTRINAVAPGAVDTPMLWDNPEVKNGNEKVEGVVGKPAEIAAAVAFLASAEASFIHGATLAVDGGRLARL